VHPIIVTRDHVWPSAAGYVPERQDMGKYALVWPWSCMTVYGGVCLIMALYDGQDGRLCPALAENVLVWVHVFE